MISFFQVAIQRLASPNIARYLFRSAVLLKIVAYTLFVAVGGVFWTATSDANFYDAIANGGVMVKNPWGNLLAVLNSWGLYSRPNLSHIIFGLNCVFIPWLLFKICMLPGRTQSAVVWYVLLLVTLYPTLSFFSTDIYRDIPMAILFLGFVYVVQIFFGTPPKLWFCQKNLLLLLTGFLCVYLLFVLRFYLAAALLMSVAAAYVFDLRKRIWVPAILYFSVLYVADALGIFNWMKIDYRLTYAGAGSSYNIDFSQGFFLINFVKSFLFSIYGFHFNGLISTAFFVLESVPVMLLTAYVLINRKYANQFVGFLIFFFFIYSGIWAIGVDALGTAVRYRIFSYLAMLIAACLIYQAKQISFAAEGEND